MLITVTALIFQEDDVWIAQCLEYDIVSFAETIEGLGKELLGQLEAVVAVDRGEGRIPFSGFKRAPERYWRMYEELSEVSVPNPPITSSPERLSGTPVFAGTRVPIQTLIDYLEAGDPLDSFLADFPSVMRKHAIVVLELMKTPGLSC